MYTGDDWHRQHAQTGIYAEREYRAWHAVAKPLGIRLVRGSIQWCKNGRFIKYWRITDEGWEKVSRSIRPTLVYDRTRTFNKKTGAPLPYVEAMRSDVSEHLPVYNLPQFSDLMDNKIYQAVVFRRFMPRTQVLLAGSTFYNPRGAWVVVKLPEGSSGQQVTITRRKRLAIEHTSIQQEFVPATTDGKTKDLRIVYVGTKPQYAFHRVAPKGSLYTNVYMGATIEMVKLDEIKSILRLAREIARPLAIFPKKVYSLDFLIHAQRKKPYLIETNTMPGTDPLEADTLHRYLVSLTKHLFA